MVTGSWYWYLRANYWINDTIYRWTCSSWNYDIRWSRGDAPSANIDFWEITLNKDDILYVWYTASWAVDNASIGDFSISYNSLDLVKKWVIQWKSKSISLIWQIGIICIFWAIDKDFYFWEETQTAVTWEITPGNFVGYLNIWGYKIPFYL